MGERVAAAWSADTWKIGSHILRGTSCRLSFCGMQQFPQAPDHLRHRWPLRRILSPAVPASAAGRQHGRNKVCKRFVLILAAAQNLHGITMSPGQRAHLMS